MLAAARRMALDFEALVLPVACLGCQRPAAGGGSDVLCQVCRYSMRPIAAPKCARCGQSLDDWERGEGRGTGRRTGTGRGTGTGRTGTGRGTGTAADTSPVSLLPSSCGFCRAWPEALNWADSAVWFDDVPRELAHGLKYSGWTVAAAPMAQAMTRHLAGRLRGADLLVPVPLGRRRLRERGYNQAAVLSGELARLTGIPSGVMLTRTRDTRTQTALDPKARRENVAGAFAVAADAGQVRGKTVVLVDDVLTTGATLGAAAEALAAAGTKVVGAVTFARAAKPE